MSEGPGAIHTLLDERRTFAPIAEFLSKARVTDQGPFEWAGLPFAPWSVGGQLNVSDDCLDRRVVARSDPEAGQAISAFVTLRAANEESTGPIAELRDHVAKLIGPIAKPKWIAFTPDLPKTRSGKIMRRLLRDIAENRKLGDTTTLADSSIVADLQRRATEEEAKEQ